MVYIKGSKMIIIEHNPIFGKRPELYIDEGNELLKVACFGSDEKAEKFEEFLSDFFGCNLVEEE